MSVASELADERAWCGWCAEEVFVTSLALRCAWCGTRTHATRPRPSVWRSRVSLVVLERMHRSYREQGVSVTLMARATWQRLGFRSWNACAAAIARGWKLWGLEMRSRSEQSAVTRRRRAAQRARERALKQCEGFTRRGRRCENQVAGGGFCPVHGDELARQSRVRACRVALAAQNEPRIAACLLVDWLAEQRAADRTWNETARRLGVSPSLLQQVRLGTKRTVAMSTVERMATGAGVRVAEIVGALSAAA